MEETATHQTPTLTKLTPCTFQITFSFILCLAMICILHRTLEKLSDKWWIKCSVLGESFKAWIGVRRDVIFDKTWGVLCESVAGEPKFILISIGQSILEVIGSNYMSVILGVPDCDWSVGWMAIFETDWEFWNRRIEWKLKHAGN